MKGKRLELAKQRFGVLVKSVKERKERSLKGWIHLSDKPLIAKKEKQKREISRMRSDLFYRGQTMENLKRQMAELGIRISENQRIIAEAEAGLENLDKLLKSRDKKEEKEWTSEFEKLQKLPLVKAIKVWHSVIYVYTDTIFIKYIGRKYEIGSFLVRIDTDEIGINNAIRIKNFCNTSDYDRYHPYTSDGYGEYFCFGTIERELQNLFEEGDYLTMVEVILKALQTGEGDSTDLIEEWKEVEN